MILRLIDSIPYDGTVMVAGLYVATPAEYHALQQRGPCRPATADEVAHHTGPIPSVGDAQHAPAIEQATAAPISEQAVSPRHRAARSKTPDPKP